jgi:outer membrane protein TolC
VRLFESALTRATTQLNGTKAKVKAGGALRTAELLASLDVSAAEVQLNTAKGDAQVQAAMFERLVGFEPPPNLILPPTPDISLLEIEAFRPKRRDLVSLHYQTVQAYDTEVFLRAKILWPTLDLRADFNYTFPITIFQPSALNAAGRVLLTIPIFQTGDEFLQARLQHIHGNASFYSEQLLAKQITQEIKTALAQVNAARQQVKTTDQQLQTAQQNYNLVSTQFKLGAITFLEVTNAQKALTDAERLRVGAGYDRELATYQFLFASGKLQAPTN